MLKPKFAIGLTITSLFFTGCFGGEIQLVKPVVTCEVAGETYYPGQSGIPASDGCNTCTCATDGGLDCTEIACQSDEAGGLAKSPEANSAINKDEITPSQTYPLGVNGEVVVQRSQSRFSLRITTADLPDLKKGDKYMVWLGMIEPFDILPLGQLSWDETAQTYTLHFEAFEGFVGYNRVVIVRQKIGADKFSTDAKLLEVIIQ